jgi:hypothetical protein
MLRFIKQVLAAPGNVINPGLCRRYYGILSCKGFLNMIFAWQQLMLFNVSEAHEFIVATVPRCASEMTICPVRIAVPTSTLSPSTVL